MKKLNYLDYNFPDIMINDIKTNSKEVNQGDLFVCIDGVTTNRNDFIDEAIDNGAAAIVTNKKINSRVPVIYVDNPNSELPKLASKFYNFKENNLTLIAVTGTNGKTTVASIIQDLLGNDICGYMGTNGITCSNFNESIKNTTPDADKLYKFFDKFYKNGCKYISMEASSEAFYRNRLTNLKYNVGIVTNVTEDHLNVHKTIDNYVSCKKELVKNVLNNGYSILNIDDNFFNEFNEVAKGRILTYGKKKSDLQIIDFKENIDSTQITIRYKNKDYSFKSPLVGEFNIYNLSAAILSLIALGFDIEYLISRVAIINVPKGRLEYLDFGQKYKIILDYAHTTDALKNVYYFLNKVKMGKVITVVGSAGGREHEKRKYMGDIILKNSDYVIFTMDDPRNEDVNRIIDDLVSISDKKNYDRIIDRIEAIHKAFTIAEENDIVLIAGKGRDNYMAIGDKYLPYNDYDVIKKYFEKGN